MSGDEDICAEIPRGFQQIAEFDFVIAGDAGDRRFARHVAFGKTVDHLGGKACLIIQNVVWNFECFCNPSSIMNILTGAATAFAACR